MDGIHIMEKVHKREAYIKVLDRPGLDLTTPSGRGILACYPAWPRKSAPAFFVVPMRAASPPSSVARSSDAAQAQRPSASGGDQALGSGRKLPHHRQNLSRPSRDDREA